MLEIARQLARFIVDVQLHDIPDAVIERTRVHLLDALACGFVGADWPWARIVREFAEEQSGAGQASVFGSPTRLAAPQAALVNGVMIGGFEANHSGHLSHTAATVTPAALAYAEEISASGEQLILALTAGAEVGCRIGHAQTRAVEDERGFHNPGANGSFAAAAAVGKLAGLDEQTMASAFGIAGSRAGGLVEYAHDGSMTKRLHPGRVSQAGMESAQLAARGFTGPHTVLEGRSGFFHAFSPSPRPERVLEHLGSEWRSPETMIKPYPCHGTGQSVVAAISGLKQLHAIDASTIRRLHIRTSDPGHMLKPRFLDPEPKNHLGAQCSLPFTAAVAFLRDLEDPLQYDESVIDDENVRSLARLVTFEAIEDHSGPLLIELDVESRTGVVRATGGPYRGSVDNPADFGDLENKFHRYSRHVLDATRRNSLIDLVRDLERVPDVRAIGAFLRP